jgi:hypothetical protein
MNTSHQVSSHLYISPRTRRLQLMTTFNDAIKMNTSHQVSSHLYISPRTRRLQLMTTFNDAIKMNTTQQVFIQLVNTLRSKYLQLKTRLSGTSEVNSFSIISAFHWLIYFELDYCGLRQPRRSHRTWIVFSRYCSAIYIATLRKDVIYGIVHHYIPTK